MIRKMDIRRIPRVAPFLVAIAIVFIAIVIAKVQTRQPKVAPLDRQLQWRAHEAKQAGMNKVTIPEWNRLEAESDINEVVKRFTVVVVQLAEKRSYESSDGNRLYTWNKLRTLETVSTPEEFATDESLKPPQEMLDLNRGEILVQTAGGTKLIDGVEVTQPGPELRNGEKYLLYLILNPSGVGLLAHGPAGIFQIEPTGRLKGFSKSGFALGDSVDSVKSELKKRHARTIN
jgi:hypothetical protein